MTLEIEEARRIALAAQGFGSLGSAAKLGDVIDRLSVLQIDSVNVLLRAHFMPIFSRIGAYDRSALEKAAYEAHTLFEYWGHEASLLPVALHPLFRFRMEQARRGERMWSGIARFGRENAAYCADVLKAVRDRGPLRASELVTEATKKRGRWWSRSEPKVALEWLFWTGQVTTAGRHHFERIYDVPERVIPARVLAMPTPSEADAQRELLRISARALGVATKDDLRDYFRLPPCDGLVRDLVENGDLVPVEVEGWGKPAYLARDLPKRRRASAIAALLSPFDPLIWYRARAQRLFAFHYRIEIYTPAAKRKHGYYVLPFLLGDRLVARVDLKRSEGVLHVSASHIEDHAEAVAGPLAAELGKMADWLGLASIRVARRGKLAKELAAAVRAAK